MDATLNGVMQEAIEYANDVWFLPLLPIEDHYDKLLGLWERVRPCDWGRIFWQSENAHPTQRVLLECMQRATLVVVGFADQDIACAWWITNLSGEGDVSRCDLSGWFPFTSRGVGSDHLLRKILSYLHGTLGIQSVFMSSPWRTVQSLCERTGLQTVAEIERYYIRGRPETLRIFRSET